MQTTPSRSGGPDGTAEAHDDRGGAGVALGISRSHAYELVRQGDLPALRLGRRVVVPIAGLEALVDALGEGADPES